MIWVNISHLHCLKSLLVVVSLSILLFVLWLWNGFWYLSKGGHLFLIGSFKLGSNVVGYGKWSS